MIQGHQLRAARLTRGLTQGQVAEATGLARSTVANLEAGRHAIGGTSLEALVSFFPELRAEVEDPRPPGFVSGGPYELVELALVYVFGHSKTPGEIIETRTVRALESGADRYGLSLDKGTGPGFRIEQEALFGGDIVDLAFSDERGGSWNSCVFEFDRALQRGETHTFAVRSFVDQNPEPENTVQVVFTIPARKLHIELRFNGPHHPTIVRRFGPVDTEDDEVQWEAGHNLPSSGVHRWAHTFTRLEAKRLYGLTWRW